MNDEKIKHIHINNVQALFPFTCYQSYRTFDIAPFYCGIPQTRNLGRRERRDIPLSENVGNDTFTPRANLSNNFCNRY